MQHRDFTTVQVETMLNSTLNPEAEEGAITMAVAAIHRLTTGCGLTAEDFAPGDFSCIDGGRPEHHLSSTDQIEVP